MLTLKLGPTIVVLGLLLAACGTDNSQTATESSTADSGATTTAATDATSDATDAATDATDAATDASTTSECGELFGSDCFSDTDYSCTNVLCVAGKWECTCTQATTGTNSDTTSETDSETDATDSETDATDSETDATDSETEATDSGTDATDSETDATDSETDATDTDTTDTGGFDPLATVEIYIDNFCNVSAEPMELWVPAGDSLEISYHNNSVDYDADVWLSYGGGFLELPMGDTWEDPFIWCNTPEPYTGAADIDIAGGGGNICPGVTVLIHCE